MEFNPFFKFDLAQCDAGIAEIQERMLVGAQKVSHAGSGGMDMVTPDVDMKNLRHLANRREILGERPPSRAQLRGYVIQLRGVWPCLQAVLGVPPLRRSSIPPTRPLRQRPRWPGAALRAAAWAS